MDYTKFEKAAIIGARALQLAYGAPPLIKLAEGMADPLVLSEQEFDAGVIPIVVVRKERKKGE